MKSTPKHWHLLLPVLALAVVEPLAAASQGQLNAGKSAASSGSARVGLVVPEMVQLFGVEDLALQWDGASGRYMATDGLCVYRNASGQYSVTARSTTGSGDFVMTGEEGSTLPYEVRWNGQSLTAGQRSTVRTDGNKTSLGCDGGSNIELQVSASESQVGSASRTGLHTDTLVLEVIAE